jgi:hypothetical protein
MVLERNAFLEPVCSWILDTACAAVTAEQLESKYNQSNACNRHTCNHDAGIARQRC